MIPTTYPDRATAARLTARMLLDIKAVHFNAAEPFYLGQRAESADLYRLPQADILPRASAAR